MLHRLFFLNNLSAYLFLAGFNMAHLSYHWSSENHYRTLAEASFEGILLSNNEAIIDANQQMSDIAGYRLSEMVGKNIIDFVIPEDRALVHHHLSVGYQLPYQHRFLCRDGSVITVETRTKQFEKDGENFVVTVIRDITEYKKAEMKLKERTKQLENANRELESFSYSVSHDLKAPLRAIDGFSKILLRKYGDKLEEEVTSKLNIIRSNALKMGQLIDDLLSFAKVNRKDLNISEIDMAGLVKSICEEIRAANPGRDLEVRIGHLKTGFGDLSFIRQVFANLLSNAVKFAKNRPQSIIEIGSYKLDDEIVYYVKDNGIGFDMRYYDKLFNVFQRLHSDEEYEGTGVGLAIVQRVVQRHGGRVWADGETGNGATFYFSLPAQNMRKLGQGLPVISTTLTPYQTRTYPLANTYR